MHATAIFCLHKKFKKNEVSAEASSYYEHQKAKDYLHSNAGTQIHHQKQQKWHSCKVLHKEKPLFPVEDDQKAKAGHYKEIGQ
jgi:hypothetical protein